MVFFFCFLRVLQGLLFRFLHGLFQDLFYIAPHFEALAVFAIEPPVEPPFFFLIIGKPGSISAPAPPPRVGLSTEQSVNTIRSIMYRKQSR